MVHEKTSLLWKLARFLVKWSPGGKLGVLRRQTNSALISAEVMASSTWDQREGLGVGSCLLSHLAWEHINLGRIHAGHDVLDCQYRHKFSDSNAWTALTGIPPKELHWPLCTGWTICWCGTLPMPVSIQSYGCCPVVVDWSLIKWLITVGRELRQHQRDSKELCSWDVPTGQQITRVLLP